MQHEQFIIQSDAQKTFDTIMKGPRIFEKVDKQDAFIDWIEKNNGETQTFQKLNLMFRRMRQSEVYAFKRLSMKLQFDLLQLGLSNSIQMLKQVEGTVDKTLILNGLKNSKVPQPYFNFAQFFVDDKENLKDIMQ